MDGCKKKIFNSRDQAKNQLILKNCRNGLKENQTKW